MLTVLLGTHQTTRRASRGKQPFRPTRCLWDSELAAAGLPFREDLMGTEPGPTTQKVPPHPSPHVCSKPSVSGQASEVKFTHLWEASVMRTPSWPGFRGTVH